MTLVEQTRNDQLIFWLISLAISTVTDCSTFGYKPASIQITAIGHDPPGLSTIDYRLTNPFRTSPDKEQFFLEQAIYLDYVFGFYLHQIGLVVGPLRAKGNRFLVFGCLNRWEQVSSDTRAL